MNVILKPTREIAVETEDGAILGRFVKGREWNGMTELLQGDKILIIETSYPPVVLSDLRESTVVEVVKASPAILSEMNKREKEE